MGTRFGLSVDAIGRSGQDPSVAEQTKNNGKSKGIMQCIRLVNETPGKM